MLVGKEAAQVLLDKLENILNTNQKEDIYKGIPLMEYFTDDEIENLIKLVNVFNEEIHISKNTDPAKGLLSVVTDLPPVIFANTQYKPKGHNINLLHIKNFGEMVDQRDSVLSILESLDTGRIPAKTSIDDSGTGYLEIERRKIKIGKAKNIAFLFLKEMLPFGEVKNTRYVFNKSNSESKKESYKLSGKLSTDEIANKLYQRKAELQKKLQQNRHGYDLTIKFYDNKESVKLLIKPQKKS